MNIEGLKAEKKEKEGWLKTLQSQIERLDEEIKQAEDLPVSAEEWVDKTYGVPESEVEYFKCFPIKYPPPYTYLKSHMLVSFQAGEQNDRKRTQPLIDAVKGWLKSECRDASTYAADMQEAVDSQNL